MKKTVLVLTDYYVPGCKAGGPIRTISNIVSRLGDRFDFRIITRDRDLRDKNPYPDVTVDDWSHGKKSSILYLSPGLSSTIMLCRVLASSHYDTLYLNSLFSFKFTILPLLLFRLNLTRGRHVILAPRGACATSALDLKKSKKSVFLMLAKSIGLYESVVWHASSEHEADDIVRLFGKRPLATAVTSPVVVAPDMPSAMKTDSSMTRQKNPGTLKAVFIGRIARMKNLDYALGLLNGLKGRVVFDIYGPSEDKSYWEECTKLIDNLAGNIAVHYQGVVEHQKVYEIIGNYHVLLLPTRGENFGHVIVESLSSGCPVIISDRTPWRNLDSKGVGWDIPLERVDAFKEVLRRCVDMNQEDYDALSRQAAVFGRNVVDDNKIVQRHVELFGLADMERHS